MRRSPLLVALVVLLSAAREAHPQACPITLVAQPISNCGAGGSGITSLNGLTGATQTFASGTGFTWTSASTTHTFALHANLQALSGLAVTADNLIAGNGSAFALKALLDCQDTGGNHLNYNTTTHAFTCGTSGGGGGATPFTDASALVKNGSDATKLVILDASLVTTGTTRTLKAPDVNGTLAVLGANSFTGIQLLPTSSTGYAPSLSWVDGQGFDRSSNGLRFQANGGYSVYLSYGGAGTPAVQVRSDVSIGFSSTTDPTAGGGPQWHSGSGSPEGVLTAVVGSLYSRTDGGAGTSLYVKESGSGNTGWVGK